MVPLPVFVWAFIALVQLYVIPLGATVGGILGGIFLFRSGKARAWMRSAAMRDGDGNAIGWLARVGDNTLGVYPVYVKLVLIYKLWRTRDVALQVLRPDGTFSAPAESWGDQTRYIWASAKKIGIVQDLLRISGQLAALVVSAWIGYRWYRQSRSRKVPEVRGPKSPFFVAFEKAWGLLALIGIAGFGIEFLADTHLASNVHHVISRFFEIFGCESKSDELNREHTRLKCAKLRSELARNDVSLSDDARKQFDEDVLWVETTIVGYHSAISSSNSSNRTVARYDALAAGKIKTPAGRQYWLARQAEIDEQAAHEKSLKPVAPVSDKVPTVADIDDKVISELRAAREKTETDLTELAPLVVNAVESDDPVDMVVSLAGPFARLKKYLVDNFSKVLATLAIHTASSALIVCVGISIGYFIGKITDRSSVEPELAQALVPEVIPEVKTTVVVVPPDPLPVEEKPKTVPECPGVCKESVPCPKDAEVPCPEAAKAVVTGPVVDPVPLVTPECIHVKSCPTKEKCEYAKACMKTCLGHHCTHFTECPPPSVEDIEKVLRSEAFICLKKFPNVQEAMVAFGAQVTEPEVRKNRIKFFYDNFVKGLEEPEEDIDPLIDDSYDDQYGYDQGDFNRHQGRRQNKKAKDQSANFLASTKKKPHPEKDGDESEARTQEGANAQVDAARAMNHVDAELVRKYVVALKTYRTAVSLSDPAEEKSLAWYELKNPLRCDPIPQDPVKAEAIIKLINSRLRFDPKRQRKVSGKEARVNPQAAEDICSKGEHILQLAVSKDYGTYESVHRKLLNPKDLTFIGNAFAVTTPGGPITITAGHNVDPEFLATRGWTFEGKPYDYVFICKINEVRDAYKAPTLYKMSSFHRMGGDLDVAYVGGSSIKAIKYTDVVPLDEALKTQKGFIVRARNFKNSAATYSRLTARTENKFEFDYNANTEKGDSGAPVFDDSGKLFGMHLGYDGGVKANIVLYLADILKKIDVKAPSVPLN